MPKVPKYNLKPLKPIYNPAMPTEPASLKQKNLIVTLCERRKIPVPVDLKELEKGRAAQIISGMLNDNYYAS